MSRTYNIGRFCYLFYVPPHRNWILSYHLHKPGNVQTYNRNYATTSPNAQTSAVALLLQMLKIIVAQQIAIFVHIFNFSFRFIIFVCLMFFFFFTWSYNMTLSIFLKNNLVFPMFEDYTVVWLKSFSAVAMTFKHSFQLLQ